MSAIILIKRKKPMITKLEEVLFSDFPTTSESESADLILHNLYSHLIFEPRLDCISQEDSVYVDLTEAALNSLPERQMASEKALIQLKYKLSEIKRHPDIFEHYNIGIKIDVDHQLIENITNEMLKHNLENSKSSAFQEHFNNCKKNVQKIINICIKSPYLYCLMPLYLFLSYRYCEKNFFGEELSEDDLLSMKKAHTYLKHVSTTFTIDDKDGRAREKRDIQLMGYLMDITGSVIPSPRYSYDESTIKDNDIFSKFQIYDELILSEQPFSYVPAPNWKQIFELLLQKNLVSATNYNDYLNAVKTLRHRSERRADSLSSDVLLVIQNVEKICQPQYFFSFHFRIKQSPYFKSLLSEVYKTLINQEDCSETDMFRSMCDKGVFLYTNLNELAFWRITRYTPSDLSISGDCVCNTIQQAFTRLMVSEKREAYIYSGLLMDFPECPDFENLKFSQELARKIYKRWRLSYTRLFCEMILPAWYTVYCFLNDLIACSIVDDSKLGSNYFRVQNFPSDKVSPESLIKPALEENLNLISKFLTVLFSSDDCQKKNSKNKSKSSNDGIAE